MAQPEIDRWRTPSRTVYRQVRIWRKHGVKISESCARIIASWYQSAGRESMPFTTFSATGKRTVDLIRAIDRELVRAEFNANRGDSDAEDFRPELRALRAVALSLPLPAMWEQVIFLQGSDDFTDLENVAYPKRETGYLGSLDWEAALAYLMQWDYGEPTDSKPEESPTCMGYGDDRVISDDGEYLMIINASYGVAGLWRRTEVEQS